jgi:hypothetical protein
MDADVTALDADRHESVTTSAEQPAAQRALLAECAFQQLARVADHLTVGGYRGAFD